METNLQNFYIYVWEQEPYISGEEPEAITTFMLVQKYASDFEYDIDELWNMLSGLLSLYCKK